MNQRKKTMQGTSDKGRDMGKAHKAKGKVRETFLWLISLMSGLGESRVDMGSTHHPLSLSRGLKCRHHRLSLSSQTRMAIVMEWNRHPDDGLWI